MSGRSGWEIALPDLKSRLGAALQLEIGQPDDELAAALIEAHAEQRGLVLGEGATTYLVPRAERSFAGLEALVAAIDRISLEKKQPATLSIWREALEEVIGAEQPGFSNLGCFGAEIEGESRGDVQRTECISGLGACARSRAAFPGRNPALSGRVGAVLSPHRALAVWRPALFPRPAGQSLVALADRDRHPSGREDRAELLHRSRLHGDRRKLPKSATMSRSTNALRWAAPTRPTARAASATPPSAATSSSVRARRSSVRSR